MILSSGKAQLGATGAAGANLDFSLPAFARTSTRPTTLTKMIVPKKRGSSYEYVTLSPFLGSSYQPQTSGEHSHTCAPHERPRRVPDDGTIAYFG